ncbi:MAG: HD domain-containing protein [Pseudomonadota bacterium]
MDPTQLEPDLGSTRAEAAWRELLEAVLRDRLAHTTDGSHDLGHLRRVWLNCKTIAAAEAGSPDHHILIAGAYLHDLVNLPKDAPDRHFASRRSGELATKILTEHGFPQAKIAAVVHAIETHSYSAAIQPETVEAQILQDADRLEALGAIGIARTFYVAGRLGSALFEPNDPFAAQRALDDKRFALDHFELKLFKIAGTMTTAAGKHIAEQRAATMRAFCTQLREELHGRDSAR